MSILMLILVIFIIHTLADVYLGMPWITPRFHGMLDDEEAGSENSCQAGNGRPARTQSNQTPWGSRIELNACF